MTSIRVEGHTSSEWKRGTPERESYLNNMELSQQRASEVLTYVLDTNLNGSYPWVRDRLQAVGYSFSKTKIKDDGKEDKKLSRRGEFKIVTNTREQIQDVINLINKDA